MWSLNPQRERRTSGPENSQSSPKMDFCNTFGVRCALRAPRKGRRPQPDLPAPKSARLGLMHCGKPMNLLRIDGHL